MEEGGICSGHPALRDRVVRQAMAHAVDKQQIVDVAELGLGTPGLGLVPAALGDFYASELQDYAFDIPLANKMLDEAGYLDTDGDGIRECPAGMDCGGRQLDIVMQIPSDIASGPREAELLASVGAYRDQDDAADARSRYRYRQLLSDLRLRHADVGLGQRPRSDVHHEHPELG